jgi:hypothetical protein
MLFLLVTEVLSALFWKVDEWSLLHKLGAQAMPFHASFYVDDVILFIYPRPRTYS